jgi:polar amino acid transport system ATP-binding protein
VLKGIDLDVMPGEVVVVLIGPSGSGKSTFLRCINHLEAIDRGSIMVAGEQIGYRLSRRAAARTVAAGDRARSAARSAWSSSSSTSSRI